MVRLGLLDNPKFRSLYYMSMSYRIIIYLEVGKFLANLVIKWCMDQSMVLIMPHLFFLPFLYL